MSYCDFNHTLFKQYVSHKTKVFPALSDDWELMNTAYNTSDGVALKSKKLNQSVYDIPMRRFITFCKTYNVTINGNKLIGEFAVGQDRSVYIKADFDKWNEKYNKRTENIISLRDAKPGHVYRTICGLSVIYLGAMYQAKVITKDWEDFSKFTKIAKVHFVQTRVDFDDDNPQYGLQPVRSYKFTQDLGYALDSDEIDNLFEHIYHSDSDIVYWDKKRIKGIPKYGVIPTIRKQYYPNQDHYAKKNYSMYYYTPLFAKYKGQLWKLRCSTTLRSAYSINEETLQFSGNRQENGYSFSSRSSIQINEDFYRIGIVE